jgi:hypothetical protein
MAKASRRSATYGRLRGSYDDGAGWDNPDALRSVRNSGRPPTTSTGLT